MNELTIDSTMSSWSSKINFTSPSTIVNQRPTERVTFLGAIFAFVFIFAGLIGNVLLITTILSVKKLRSNIINIFIVSVSQGEKRERERERKKEI